MHVGALRQALQAVFFEAVCSDFICDIFLLVVRAFLFCQFPHRPFRILCEQDGVSFYVLTDKAGNHIAVDVMA